MVSPTDLMLTEFKKNFVAWSVWLGIWADIVDKMTHHRLIV